MIAADAAPAESSAVERLRLARRLLDELTQLLRENQARSWIDLVDGVAQLAAPTADESQALATLTVVNSRYRGLSAHRDGLDELYLPRPDPAAQRAATAELSALRDRLTAVLREQGT